MHARGWAVYGMFSRGEARQVRDSSVVGWSPVPLGQIRFGSSRSGMARDSSVVSLWFACAGRIGAGLDSIWRDLKGLGAEQAWSGGTAQDNAGLAAPRPGRMRNKLAGTGRDGIRRALLRRREMRTQVARGLRWLGATSSDPAGPGELGHATQAWHAMERLYPFRLGASGQVMSGRGAIQVRCGAASGAMLGRGVVRERTLHG